ncbi:hypothetical protein [Methylocapsa palsarum]|uniref:Chromate transporter n=1 Tax=Methylocapsa palsarum TaxID=1612308 RepID=A0A1I3VWD7_9HYPH|nr:chromate transporter [Methylocapsa palsarum]
MPKPLIIKRFLPFWTAIRAANSAVVGILGAALDLPVWTNAVLNPRDFALALAGFLLLTV